MKKKSTIVTVSALLALFIAALALIGSTLVKPSAALQAKDPARTNEILQKPLVYDGMITIKVKKHVGELAAQEGSVSFNIPSLDLRAEKYNIDLLEQRFNFNPANLREGVPDLSRIYRVEFPPSHSVYKVAKDFSTDPNIEYAEPIPIDYPDEIPNDQMYDLCQHLPQIYAPEAWDVHHGEDGAETVIAIIDNGTYWKHPDLLNNIWQNLGEDLDGDGRTIEMVNFQWEFDPDDINGLDDDGNGRADDFIGWDFYENDNDPDHNSGEDHGTHTAGIAAGVTNNTQGIASVSWNVKVMPLQVASPNGAFAGAYDAIIYAAENGAAVNSNSWGSSVFSQANQDVFTYVASLGCITVASAGNNNDEEPHYPSQYRDVLSVASLNVNDTKASYSCFDLSVDISCPGGGYDGGILSTLPNGEYGLKSGTSMACPMVAGCLGLLKSYHPDWTYEQLITQVMGTADDIDSLNMNYINKLGTGRVNAFRMLTEDNVVMPPMFMIEQTGLVVTDNNGNNINEPGEQVELDVEFRNFRPYLEEDNVVVTLSTSDPDIIIIDSTATVNIPSDDFFLAEGFTIEVGPDATSHFAELNLHIGSTMEIAESRDFMVSILVAPSGAFVFEGEEGALNYSGTYIKGILERLDIPVTYSNSYPETLIGFSTVFLSHGNLGEILGEGTMFQEEDAVKVQDYLEDGGRLYFEMGGLFAGMGYFSYPNLVEMMGLFGVESFEPSLDENLLDTLTGIAGTPFDGITFYETTQTFSWYIDDLTPDQDAMAKVPFEELGYGNVSIMNEDIDTYGHKVFYFGYNLGELVDRDAQNSRNNVLVKILEFLGYELADDFVLVNFTSDKVAGGIPLEVAFTDMSLTADGQVITSWEWDLDGDGTIDATEQNPAWTYDSPGQFDVMLIASNGTNSDTLVLEDYITINSGYLVYEGKAGEYAYSGTYFLDYFQENGTPVTYTNDFPSSLSGFWAVFLSYGNWGFENTVLDDHMAALISDYLMEGGYVYLEGGDPMGFDQPDNTELHNLFGIQSAEDGTANNIIDSLYGMPDALTASMYFTSSSQLVMSWIDYFIPTPEAKVAFVESDYGNVAVQHEGDYNQRTFCFSYALGDLDDGEEPNTRDELTRRICEFFDIYVGVEEPAAPAMELSVYPNPFTGTTSLNYELESPGHITLAIYNHLGQKTSILLDGQMQAGSHQVEWNASGLPAGIYIYRLQAGERQTTGKVLLLR